MTVIPITKEDIPHAAQVLTNAFIGDPIFRYIFCSPRAYLRKAPWLFSTWIRWSIMYGCAWMSPDRQAVVLLRSTEHSRMSLRSMIRAGMLPTPFRLGWIAFVRFYFHIVALLDKKHAAIMGDTSHWYGWMIGAHEPGKGMARSLFAHCANVADERQLPIFLETATPANLGLYNAKGFEIVDQESVSQDCTIYFLVRQPQVFQETDAKRYEKAIIHS